jgi:hypothetical protein
MYNGSLAGRNNDLLWTDSLKIKNMEHFQDVQVLDGSSAPNRFAQVPTYNELLKSSTPLPCNPALDNTQVNVDGEMINLDGTVGGYCQYNSSSDPLSGMRKIIIEASTDLNGKVISSPDTSSMASNTNDLPIKYTINKNANGQPIIRDATKFEYQKSQTIDETRRPLSALPRKIVALEGYYGGRQGSNAQQMSQMTTFPLNQGYYDVTELVISRFLYMKEYIDIPQGTNTIYQDLVSIGFPSIGDNAVLAFVASHPLATDVAVGKPDENPLTQSNYNINTSLASPNAYNLAQGVSTSRDGPQPIGTLENGRKLLTMLYNINGNQLTFKEDYQFPYKSWNFPRITYQNPQTPALRYTEKSPENLNSLLQKRLISEIGIGLNSPSVNPHTSQDGDWNSIESYVVSLGRGYVPYSQDPSYERGLVVRWKLEGDSDWTVFWHNGTAGKSQVISSVNIGDRLVSDVLNTRVYDYSIEYSFSMSLKINQKSTEFRNIFSHGTNIEGQLEAYPSLSIMPDDGSEYANNLMLAIMTQDSSLIYGETFFVPALDAPGSVIPIGEWVNLTVSINDKNGKIYISPNRVISFTLGASPVWPFTPQKFTIADSSVMNPVLLSRGLKQKEGGGTLGFSLSKFYWYPMELPEDYIRKYLSADPRSVSVLLMDSQKDIVSTLSEKQLKQMYQSTDVSKWVPIMNRGGLDDADWSLLTYNAIGGGNFIKDEGSVVANRGILSGKNQLTKTMADSLCGGPCYWYPQSTIGAGLCDCTDNQAINFPGSIIKATYGKNRTMDVTNIIQRVLIGNGGNSLSYPVENYLLGGDPDPGIVKTLTIKYVDKNGNIKTQSWGEHSTATIIF